MENMGASIVRVLDVNRGYTMIRNDIFRDKTISLKAKGLYCLIWSLPDDWKITVVGLASLSKDGRDGSQAAVMELEDHGYLVHQRARLEDGLLAGSVFKLYQTPMTEIPVQDPMTEYPAQVFPTQLNTKGLRTNKNSLVENKGDTKSNEDTGVTKDAGARTKKFVPPTTEEVAAYCKEHGYTIDAERFVAHYETVGWVYGKNRVPIKSWKSAVVTWVKNDKAFAPSPAPKKAVPWDYD